ncbi:hypothetical protein [Caballeronia telluris]|uniref:hypothetical protein n=1 Tax=Caballeronia telluris TaxID=326475 RepID=UPI001F26BB77|nr:hypothetical protein [Caballeronia telluris]
MTPNTEMVLVEELRRDEGVRYRPYLDSKGIPTVEGRAQPARKAAAGRLELSAHQHAGRRTSG